MTNSIIQYVLYLVILVALAIPLGAIAKVMNGEEVWLGKLSPGGESHLQDS